MLNLIEWVDQILLQLFSHIDYIEAAWEFKASMQVYTQVLVSS
jgi:hypothetical protein